jgi:mono/diheme cytochrome c family protein
MGPSRVGACLRAAWAVGIGVCLVLAACGSDGNPEEGARIYTRHCYSCHGESGSGDGPTARLMGIAPANLPEAVRKKSRAELLGTIARGRQAMPAFGRVLTEEQREAVYQYLKTLEEHRSPTVSRGLDPTGSRGLR